MVNMREDDILIINVDYGNDLIYKGIDYIREYIFVMIYGNKIKKGFNLGVKDIFVDIGVIVVDILNVKLFKYGLSFKEDLF